MTIEAILVDDESLPRKLLRGKLNQCFPEIEILAEAQNGEEAFESITNLTPDLVFLDIAMPRESGFDLLRRLPHLNFELIFVTSYDQYALEAIEFCAIGYIVKPISTENLVHAVENAKKRIQLKQGYGHNQLLVDNLTQSAEHKKIALPTSSGIEFISVKDIIRCEGYQKYTKIHISDGRIIVSSNNIGKFVSLLENYGFYAIHKSHVINTKFISSYLKEGLVMLSDGSQAPVSRRKKQEFITYLKNLN